jgi:fluoride ion exporter CrcB/FEX
MHANITLKPREFVIALSSAALGGLCGTFLRDLLTSLEHLPSPTLSHVNWLQEIPWVLLAINMVGAFLATRLLRGPLRHHDPNDATRILVITGFFGGLTSYSGLFVDLSAIWHVCVGGCLAVALGAVLSGLAAGWLGLVRFRR